MTKPDTSIGKERIKRLLVSALQNAIDYEQTRIDANVHLGDKQQEREMNKDIKAWQKMLDFVYPNRPMTLRQYLNSLPADCSISVHELMKENCDV